MIIQIIIFVMAIMNFAAGIVAFLGSERKHRLTAFWFLLAACASAVWGSSIAIFLNLSPAETDIAPIVVACIYISPFPLIIGLAGYNCWNTKKSRPILILACIAAAFFASIIVTRPDLVYSEINLFADAPNTVSLVGPFTPFYLCYEGFLLGTTTIGIVCVVLELWHKKKQGRHIGADLIFFGGFMATMTVTFFFDMLLPPWNYELIWIGPIATTAASLAVFYRIIKQSIDPAQSTWINSFGYIIVVACAAVVYLVIFNIIFTTLFPGNQPSAQVLILNFIMFLIVIAFTPVLREIFAGVSSTVSVNKFDMPYITRKLSQYASHPSSYSDLAELLTTHLHFNYIGLIVDGKLYGPHSKSADFSKEEIQAIAKVPLSPQLWQHPDEATQIILNRHDIVSIASLDHHRQIIIGKPVVKRPLTKRETVQLETVLNLVAAIL